MLSSQDQHLRDWGLFVLVAFLPAIAIGLLGLRALDNEEAAIKREMGALLEQAADAAERQYGSELAALAAGQEMPFADTLSIPAPASEPAPNKDSSRRSAGADCLALARTSTPAARATFLADCESTRSSGGRWLWLVIALSPESAIPAARLEKWLDAHGAELGIAERAAARIEVESAPWLAAADKKALQRKLDGGSDDAAVPLQSAERYAMRLGRPRIEWSHRSSRGLLLRQQDGAYRGFVVHPASLSRAVRGGWPDIPADMRAQLVIGVAPGGRAAFEALADGAHVELTYANPEAVEMRTQRSKRILLAVALCASLIAIALVALLFARMRAERRVSALRTDFVAAVSHELRTPIASIRMLSELLADGSVDDEEEQHEMHGALAREAKRLGDTVNRLLGFSRMEAGKHTAQRTVCAVAPPVQDAIATIIERHPRAEITSDLDHDIEAPIDAEAVMMAVQNLLTNALKYAQPPYSVHLAANKGGARIEVRDAGPGLSKRQQQRIFKPFERADDRLSQATEGSGIGLSLVNHVARSHQGKAGVSSAPGKGSTFFLWLPMAADTKRSAEDSR